MTGHRRWDQKISIEVRAALVESSRLMGLSRIEPFENRMSLTQNLRRIEETESPAVSDANSSLWPSVWPWVVGAVLVAVIGTWLVWFSASLQRKFQEEDIRAACQRVMPETVERCVDTVTIQRGVARR
jgi:hypothetical protein